MQSSSSNGVNESEKKILKKESEEDEHPGLILLSEHFEHNAELRTIKYVVKYLLNKEDKVFEKTKRKMIAVGAVMLPLCLLGCMRKMIEYGESHGLYSDALGIIFSSTQIPFGGRICESIKPENMDLDLLIERILEKLANLDVELKGGQQFEVIVNGVQQQIQSSKTSNEFIGKEMDGADANISNENDNLFDDEDVEEVAGNSADENDDEEPGAKLLAEKFQQNLDTRTVKYTGKFKLVNVDKIFCKLISGGQMDPKKIRDMAVKLVPDSFNICVQKMRAHARGHGILPNCIGFTLRSPQLPNGFYSEPLRPNVNLTELLGRMLDVACAESALEDAPYTMIITGQQRDDLNQNPGSQLLDEFFEQNTEERTVKYTGKFFVEDDMDKIFDGYEGSTEYAVMMEMVNHIYPKCFHDCFEKMLDHGLRYALKPTKVGIIVRSEKIPTNGGEICEPVKTCTDLGPVILSILEKLAELDVDLSGEPFTVIASGADPNNLYQ